MSKTVLIIGAGPGLGKHLLNHLSGFDHQIALSRTDSTFNHEVQHLACDVANLAEHVSEIKTKISLVVYLPSAFGESTELTDAEYEEFMDVGPKLFLSSFNCLKESNTLEDSALFISIGSTASETASSALQASNNPMYSVAKLTQKALTARLAQAHKKFRFANITLGSIGGEDSGIGYEHICQTVQHLYLLSDRTAFSDITLIPVSDIE